MPTYEYLCASCDRTFDVVQSFSDPALTECPTCGAPVRKVFGNVGIVFKGSGFYKTDSRSDARRSSSRPTERSGGESTGGSETKASESSTPSTGTSDASGDSSSAKPAASSPAATPA